MGTDIHAVFQTMENNEWKTLESEVWDQYRDYMLFAWLANVRNGFGFAGTKTHTPLIPISMPRGLPDDYDNEYERDDESYPYIGDHSFSWLDIDEILLARVPIVVCSGVLSIKEYEKWDKYSKPEYYSGGVFGPNVILSESPDEITPETTHVRVEWNSSEDRFAYFLEEITKLRLTYPGPTRMVFGFDS